MQPDCCMQIYNHAPYTNKGAGQRIVATRRLFFLCGHYRENSNVEVKPLFSDPLQHAVICDRMKDCVILTDSTIDDRLREYHG